MKRHDGFNLTMIALKMVIIFILLVTLFGIYKATSGPRYDYTMNELETALLRGEYVSGSTALIRVKDVGLNPVLGYVIHSGQSMHFVSHVDPGAYIGDEIVVEIISYVDIYGEFTISYERR